MGDVKDLEKHVDRDKLDHAKAQCDQALNFRGKDVAEWI
jgi:hypothetical protein